MKYFLSCFALLLVLACAPVHAQGQQGQSTLATPREFEMKDGDTTYVMKQYIMVLLRRGDQATTFTKEELAKIQEGHMANIGRLAKEGFLHVAGPFGDDTELRGIFILDVESVEAAQALVATDPAIQAGRLKAEFHPWWCAKGTVLR
jgi:uncharacterized protein YciI